MTKADKEEIKEILHDYVSGVMARVDSKFEIIDIKLDEIKEQTTKHNGRMSILEFKEARHTIDCPNVDKIRALEDHTLTTKSIKNWIVGSVSIVGILMSILFIIIKLLL
jgi:hypothetical protein